MKVLVMLAISSMMMTACSVAESPTQERTLSSASGDVIDNPFDNDDISAGSNSAETTEEVTSVIETPIGENLAEARDFSPETPQNDAPLSIPAVSGESSSCNDGKRVCGDMNSCEDARFHLNQCGMSRLDGDGDGVPCEKIC